MFENVGIDGVVPLSFNTVGRILANWVIVQTQGKANILIIGSDEIASTAGANPRPVIEDDGSEPHLDVPCAKLA